jgi:hypothetical protein
VAETFEHTTWARRVRSVVLLVLLLVVLGALTAVGIGGTVVLLGSFIDKSLD